MKFLKLKNEIRESYLILNCKTHLLAGIKILSGLSVEGKGEGIVVSAVEEGRLAHVQGNK